MRFPSRGSKPANYVLWCDGLDYYVSKRIGVKRDSWLREHFVAFFATESEAWRSAELRQLSRIEGLQNYVKFYRSQARAKRRQP